MSDVCASEAPRINDYETFLCHVCVGCFMRRATRLHSVNRWAVGRPLLSGSCAYTRLHSAEPVGGEHGTLLRHVICNAMWTVGLLAYTRQAGGRWATDVQKERITRLHSADRWAVGAGCGVCAFTRLHPGDPVGGGPYENGVSTFTRPAQRQPVGCTTGRSV